MLLHICGSKFAGVEASPDHFQSSFLENVKSTKTRTLKCRGSSDNNYLEDGAPESCVSLLGSSKTAAHDSKTSLTAAFETNQIGAYRDPLPTD